MPADGLDGLSPAPDDNGLLGFTLDEESDTNVYGPLGFAKLLHLGGKGIGKLVFQQLERGFPEILYHEEAERLSANVFGIEFEALLREERPDSLKQPCQGRLVGGGDYGPLGFQDRAAGRRDQVGFGVDRQGWDAERRGESGELGEAGRRRFGSGMEVKHQIHAPRCIQGELAHAGLEQVSGIEQAWKVVKDVLGVAFSSDAGYGEAGGLGLGADQGQVLPDQRVEKS